MKRVTAISLLVLGSNLAVAADTSCMVHVVKNTCWDKYSVNVEIMRSRTQQLVSKGTVEKGKSQTDITFTCPLGEPIGMRSTFSPAFWEGTENKMYMTKRIWDIPLHMPEKSQRWEIAVCFPNDFQSVPIPPVIGTDCKCPAVVGMGTP